MMKMEKKRKNENEEEQKMIKKGKKKRIIKDWKNPVRIFNIKSGQMMVHELYMIHLHIPSYFLECRKKIKGLRIYIMYI